MASEGKREAEYALSSAYDAFVDTLPGKVIGHDQLMALLHWGNVKEIAGRAELEESLRVAQAVDKRWQRDEIGAELALADIAHIITRALLPKATVRGA